MLRNLDGAQAIAAAEAAAHGLHMGPRPAFLTSGRRTQEVLVVNTATGPTPHLTWASSSSGSETFCGRPVHHVSRTWFALTGCKRCLTAARRQDLARITDVDGSLVDLADL